MKKNQNQVRDLNVLKQSEEIRAKTKDLVTYLRDIREKLLKATENTGPEMKNLSGEDKVAITMLGGQKHNGLAYTGLKRN